MKSGSSSSSSSSSSNSSGSKARKKHKKLDAICEKAYNRKRGRVEEELDGGNDNGGYELGIRRSMRVRKAPVILDVSPSPVKKRRKVDRGSLSGKREKESTPSKHEDEGDDEETNWKCRLRSKARNVGSERKGKEDSESLPGKKKLLEDLGGAKDEIKLGEGDIAGDDEEFEDETSTVVKSKRPGRIKASKLPLDGKEEIDLNNVKEMDGDDNEMEVLGNDGDDNEELEDALLDLNGGIECGNEGLVEKMESENPNDLEKEEDVIGKGKEDIDGQIGELQEQVECLKQGGDHGHNVELDRIATGDLEGECPGDEPMEVQNGINLNKQNDKIAKRRIKEGRRCGLCGGTTDGKPPKRLAYDMAESENDVCSGSSASEETNYDIWDGFGEEPGWLGRLLGPIMDRFGITGTWVHQHCAVWSPEVYFAGLGRLKNARAALFRGRALKCSRCGRRGATLGCRVDRCPKTYHLPCARADGSIFNHRKFLIACSHHRHLFQPYGDQYMYKMKTKKMKLQLKKTSNDAWKKDIEAEEKWLEGEDEEFLKRERKRLHRDILRIAPVYIGGSNSEGEQSFEGWESVAGLQDVIRCMKEVVILPLLYPDLFINLGLTPPRGVLLHGHPGTGKTLVVRSLIGSCARGDKRIAYFARKGADCLGKYVGDAERQLRLLFQVAEKCQPSIIFFDEIDGLAPRRNRNQDQTHSSVVSTLLALLDGLKSRGSVVVIGATNRPDAVDPALRRPGRFDREIYFPLPSEKDRAEILALHTRKWPKPVSGSLLNWAARKTAGFAGADLQALCTQAAIIALKRNCPLQKILSDASEKASDGHRVPLPAFAVEEQDWLEALSCAPPPCSHREAGMAINDVTSSPLPAHLISCLLEPLTSLLVSLFLDERLWLPPPLSKAAKMVRNVIISALNKKNVNSDCWWAHVKNLLQEADIAKEMEREFLRVGVLIKDSTFAGSSVLNDDDGKMHDAYHSSLLRNTSYASGKNSGLRILIAGGPRSGQGHLASCLVHCFVGNIEIQKVDMATISQEGRGDVLQGLTQILMKCSCLASCVIFMPRIDLWAINQDDEEKSDPCSTDDQTSEGKSSSEDDEDDVKAASGAWSSFMEQVDSVCVSTSLMILATSEVSFQQLPISIRKFFNRDISKCTDSTPEYTVPRFSLQTDGNFNQDAVIISSAAKLSNDVVQQFIQLLHHGTHITNRFLGDYKIPTAVENVPDVASKLPVDLMVKVPLPNNSRQVKGKSSLTMAISSMGSQILGYPHFAELCWVTSKLKDGPYSDINGPWKGWPFNTCIIRSNNSLEKVAVISGSNNMGSKGKSGVVRGLVAIGLSAYRGVYTSLREVSIEIRMVLRLLVENINAKIHAGKDRYQYACILSQVAYLEDVVNSWAYTLQSLEQDAHLMLQNPLPDTLQSLEAPNECDNQFFDEECKLGDINRSSQEIETLDKIPQKNAVRNSVCVDMNNANGGSPQQVVLDHSDISARLQSSASADDLGGNNSILDGNIETGVVPENTGNHKMENGVGSIKCSVGFASTESKPNEQVVFSEEMISPPICLYRCCMECLLTLNCLMRKLLTHEWELHGNCKRVEDIHDLVASFSMNLLSALRKEYVAEKKAKYENHGKLIDLQDKRACQFESSENKLIMPMNCSCHSMGERDDNVNDPSIPHVGLDTKFIYRDGVLTPVDLENDVSFHCKFETLCLCSLIEWMAMTKRKSFD